MKVLQEFEAFGVKQRIKITIYIMQHAEYYTIPYTTYHTSNTIYHTKENYMPDTTYYKLYTIDIYIYTYTLYRYTVESSLCKMLCTVHWLYSICNMPNATRYMLYDMIDLYSTLYTNHYTLYTLHYTSCILYTMHYTLDTNIYIPCSTCILFCTT